MPQQPIPPPVLDATPTVLIIEDDPATLNFLAIRVRQAGYQTLEVPSGKEGLIAAWRNLPAAIVLDTGLPDIDGLEVVRKLRRDRRSAQIPILVLSGRSQPEDILACLEAGVNEYIVKRSNADVELIQKIDEILRPASEKTGAARIGRLITFLSAKGGTGTSSLCANFASEFSVLADPATVAVVDMVLPLGSIGQIVGEEPAKTVVELSQLSASQLTPGYLTSSLPVPALWGFQLAAGCPDPAQAHELRMERLGPLFDALLSAFDYVFVDIGRTLSRVSMPIIDRTHAVVVIISPDTLSVNLTSAVLTYLYAQTVPPGRLYVVLNRAVGLEGMTRSQIERNLDLTIRGALPYMGGDFALANNLNVPLQAKFPDSMSTLALRQMAAELLEKVDAMSVSART